MLFESVTVNRPAFVKAIRIALRRSRIVALLGPRQCGKTTLARVVGKGGHFLDLEDPTDRMRVEAAPKLALESLEGLVVIDEVQTLPELFPILRVLADRDPLPARFLILGSASPSLIRGVLESLAGRVEFVDLAGFDTSEVAESNAARLWLRGGFPDSFLAKDDVDSFAWRQGFARTFLERDLNLFGFRLPSARVRRFWTMVAHRHGQSWNAAPLAQSLSVDRKTVNHYLDVLTGAFMLRRLQPWFENVGKREVKAPKIYVRDSGLLHGLLNLRTTVEVESHPQLGASWEGFAMEHVIRYLDADGMPTTGGFIAVLRWI